MPGPLPALLHRVAVAVLVWGTFAWVPAGALAATTVSNVRAAQRAGTKLVDIDYDITGTTGWVSVSVQVSSDAGASYAVPAVAFTGAFGSVPAGRNRRVTCNAGADWNRH